MQHYWNYWNKMYGTYQVQYMIMGFFDTREVMVLLHACVHCDPSCQGSF